LTRVHRIPDGEIVVRLLGRTRLALHITQKELAELLGVARRTISRWEGRESIPSASQLHVLARAVHPHDAALAAELAAEGDATLEGLGLRPPAPAPPPAPVAAAPPVPAAPPSEVRGPPPRAFPRVEYLIDSIVHVAAQALDGEDAGRDPIGTVRAVLRVAFARASALGLTVDEVRGALSPRAAPAVGDPKVAPVRERSRASR
jgi:transcriptional regulator with XRE-family HTH domain